MPKLVKSGPKLVTVHHQTRILNLLSATEKLQYSQNCEREWSVIKLVSIKWCPSSTPSLYSSLFYIHSYHQVPILPASELGYSLTLFSRFYLTASLCKVRSNRKRTKIRLLRSGMNILNPGPTCSLCSLQGRKNQLLKQCSQCQHWFHRTCLQIKTYQFNTEILPNVNWSCSPCSSSTTPKVCNICDKSHKRWITQTCEDCNDNFHKSCIERILRKQKNKSNLKCEKCFTTSIQQATSLNIPIVQLRKGGRLAHVNVRDILSLNKFDEIKILLFQHQFDVLVIGETWLYDKINNDELKIPGYQILRKDRPAATKRNSGGGLICYIKEDWEVELITSPFQHPVESISFTMMRNHMAHLTITGIYKPEAGSLAFRRMLDDYLDTSPPNTYILGDMNVDVSSQSLNSRILKSLLLQHNFTQLIKTATRITETSQTLIDLIVTNSPDKQCDSGVISTGIADHELIYTIRSKSKVTNIPKVINVRSIKSVNSEKLNKYITAGPWWAFNMNSNDVDNCFNLLNATVQMAFDKFCPKKTMRVKRNGPRWWTPTINKLLKTRDAAKPKNTNSPQERDEFRKIRNQCVRAVREEKSKQLEKLAEENENPSKSYWKLFNEEIGRKQSESTIKSMMNENTSQLLTENKNIADYLCDTYSTESPQIHGSVNNFTNSNWTPSSQCHDKLNEFSFSLQEIQSAIQKLKNYKTPGTDGVTPEMLKIISPSVSPILEYLFNLSARTGIYPQYLK